MHINNTSNTNYLTAIGDDRPLTSIVSQQLRGTRNETGAAARSIMQYITEDIENRVRDYDDISGNVMLEYGFVVPSGASSPITTSVQIRDITSDELDDMMNSL